MQMTKEDIAIDKEYLDADLVSLLEGTPHEGKKLFYRFIKKWPDFLESLDKEDRLILLKMILEICYYNECAINAINLQDSQSNIDHLFFLLAMMLQQKRIDKLNTADKKRDLTFLDFV